MNRPLKRLNHNKGRKQQVNKRTVKKALKNQPNPNFLDALSEYKRIRDMSRGNAAPSTSKDNQENLKAYESITVISDDDLEDGEIIEDKVTHYVSLIAESFNEVERSKRITDRKSPDSSNVNQPIFYVDKSADNVSEVPLYTSLSGSSNEQMDVDDSVIILNDTHSNSDDSVIFIDDKTPVKPTFSNGCDFIALSPIPHDSQKIPEKSGNRRERQKARFKTYKQRKMVEKVLELQSNGLLEGIAPIKVPLKSSTAVSSAGTSTMINLKAIPKPTQITSNADLSLGSIPLPPSPAVQSVPLPSSVPLLSQVVQSMIRPVQSVAIIPSSAQNLQFRPTLLSQVTRMPQIIQSTPVNENLRKNGNGREKRKILIDGSNVAMGFTTSEVGKKAMCNDPREFSAEGMLSNRLMHKIDFLK